MVANYLSTAQYTLSLAKTCVTYLCQPHHDPTLDQNSTATHLVNGVYRLHHFATDAWSKLTEICALCKEVDKDSEDWRELVCLLCNLQKTRANASYHLPDEETDLLRLKDVQDSEAETYKLLSREAHFLKNSEVRLFEVDKGKSSANRDSLSVIANIRIPRRMPILRSSDTSTNHCCGKPRPGRENLP